MPDDRAVFMVHHGKGDIFITPSATRDDKVHYTVVDPEGHANCTCEGWRSHKKCWHVSEALDRVGFHGEPTDFQVSL